MDQLFLLDQNNSSEIHLRLTLMYLLANFYCLHLFYYKCITETFY